MAGVEPATSSLPRKRSNRLSYISFCQSGRRESNPRPSAWKADALPTELLPPVTTHRSAKTTSKSTLWSGRRESNPRPSAWEADALPTELLPLSHRGWGRIRTSEGMCQQIYSLPRLTASVPTQNCKITTFPLLPSTVFGSQTGINEFLNAIVHSVHFFPSLSVDGICPMKQA